MSVNELNFRYLQYTGENIGDVYNFIKENIGIEIEIEKEIYINEIYGLQQIKCGETTNAEAVMIRTKTTESMSIKINNYWELLVKNAYLIISFGKLKIVDAYDFEDIISKINEWKTMNDE